MPQIVYNRVMIGNNDLDHQGVKETIIRHTLAYYPSAQAIYLFGSFGTADEWPDSDIDVAVLLPHKEAKAAGPLALSDLHLGLSQALGHDVDLLNARLVATVFQMAIIFGEVLYCTDRRALDEFEMVTLSQYQRLNEERAEILAAFGHTGRAYAV